MELTIKKEVEETIHLDIPCFFKLQNEQKYLAILSEEQVISIINRDGWKSYQNADSWLFKSDIKTALTEWVKIDEREFLEAHEQFLKSLSLEPVLTDPDDLKNIL